MKTAGQIGYEAYGEAAAWKTFDGRDMPRWEALADLPHGAETRRRWEAAAAAIQAMPREPHERVEGHPGTEGPIRMAADPDELQRLTERRPGFDAQAAMERLNRFLVLTAHDRGLAFGIMQAIAEQVAAERPPMVAIKHLSECMTKKEHDEVKRLLDLARQPQPIDPLTPYGMHMLKMERDLQPEEPIRCPHRFAAGPPCPECGGTEPLVSMATYAKEATG